MGEVCIIVWGRLDRIFVSMTAYNPFGFKGGGGGGGRRCLQFFSVVFLLIPIDRGRALNLYFWRSFSLTIETGKVQSI